MPRTLISLGANLGNVRESMRSAKRLLTDSFGDSNLVFSHLYRTPAVGGPSGQCDFLNAVAAIQTDRSVWEVWETIQAIESALGRQRQHRWEARRIDVDLILYDQQRIWTPHLKVPHPRMCMRTFVVVPALEIVPEWIEPVTGWNVIKLHQHLHDSQSNRSVVRVICQDHDQLSRLNREFHKTPGHESVGVAWDTASTTEIASLDVRSQQIECPPHKLTIAAVASPDPMTILWEDCSKPWVDALNLSSSVLRNPNESHWIDGPRYLMPADDPKWAVHEIIAADHAMQCSLEVVEAF